MPVKVFAVHQVEKKRDIVLKGGSANRIETEKRTEITTANHPSTITRVVISTSITSIINITGGTDQAATSKAATQQAKSIVNSRESTKTRIHNRSHHALTDHLREKKTIRRSSSLNLIRYRLSLRICRRAGLKAIIHHMSKRKNTKAIDLPWTLLNCQRSRECRLTSIWSTIGIRPMQTQITYSFLIGLLTEERERTGGQTQTNKT